MRVAIYTRVSTEKQVEGGHSLDEQYDRLVKHVQTQGWELTKIYTDAGLSAKNLNRTGIKEIIKDMEIGIFDAVIVHKLDRLTRSIGDLDDLIELFNKHNIKLISLSENIDTSTAMGRFFVNFLGILAQMYRENLGEEVRKGMAGRVKKGMPTVSLAMFGYDLIKDKGLIINKKESKYVKWIFNQYLSGVGANTIAKKLNEMGIKSKQGALFNQNKIMLILKNYHYIGKVHWKASNSIEDERIVVDGQHEPIIDEELFLRAKNIIERKRNGLMSQSANEYIFSGIVRCGSCGMTYYGSYSTSNDKKKIVYICTGNRKRGICKQSNISENVLTRMLFSFFEFENGEKVELNEEEKEPTINISELLVASEERRKRWQLAYGDGFMSYEDFSNRMKEEMEKVSELESMQKDEQPLKQTITIDDARKILLDIKIEWDDLPRGTRKRFIQSLFQRIVILKDETGWEIKDYLLI